MRKFSILVILLISTLIWGGALTMQKVKAEDNCPALSLTDIPSGLTMKEIYSNDKTAKYAIRMYWKNSFDNIPTTTAIFRKTTKQAFEKIGEVSGNTNTFLDTRANGKEGGYIYYLESTYFCGGKMTSKPQVFLMNEQMDASKPTFDALFQDSLHNLMDNERIFIAVSEYESAIKNSSLKISTSEGIQIPKKIFATYGNAHTQFLEIHTDQFEKDTDHALSLEAENSAGNKLTMFGYPLTVLSQKNAFTITSHKPGNTISLGTPFVVTGSLTNSIGTEVSWSYSTDNGNTWTSLSKSPIDTNNLTNTEIIIPKIPVPQNFIMLKGEVNNAQGEAIARDTIPLFIGNIKLNIQNNGTFTGPAFGSVQIVDSYTGQPLKFTKESPAFQADKPTFFTFDETPIFFTIAPGDYFLSLSNSNAVIFPIYLISNLHYFFSNGEETRYYITYTLPIAAYIERRTGLDNNDISIINGELEPQELATHVNALNETIRIRALPPIAKNTNETENQESLLRPALPVSVGLTLCTPLGRCTLDKYATTEAKEVKITFESAFQNFTSDAFFQTIGFKDTSPRNYLTIDNKFLIYLPNNLQNELNDKDEIIIRKVAYPNNEEIYSITLPYALVTFIYQNGYMLSIESLSGKDSCIGSLNLKTSGQSTPMLSICQNITLKAMLFPQTRFDIGISTTSTTDEKVFTESKTTDPLANITRGELAYMISRSVFFPTGQYQNNTSTFADLPETHQYAKYLLGMVAYYVMSGDSSTSKIILRPDDPVTRVEALKIIIKSIGGLPYTSATTLPFVDIDNKEWYYKYILQAYANNAIKGYTENGKMYFKPKNPITKSEVVALIKQLLGAKLK